MLFERVEEEALNPSLVQHYLLKARNERDRIRDTVRSSYLALGIWVPEADFEHVVAFFPGSVSEAKGVKNLHVLVPSCIKVERYQPPVFGIEGRLLD